MEQGKTATDKKVIHNIIRKYFKVIAPKIGKSKRKNGFLESSKLPALHEKKFIQTHNN